MLNIISSTEENVNAGNNQPYNNPDNMCYPAQYANKPSQIMQHPDYQGGILEEIRSQELNKDATRYEMTVTLLNIYEIKRYKERFCFFHENHYVQISEEYLGMMIYGTFQSFVEYSGNSDFVNNIISELKRNPSIAISDYNISTTKLASETTFLIWIQDALISRTKTMFCCIQSTLV